MQQRKLNLSALALMSCLALPTASHALICPPGETESAGRCVPTVGSSEHKPSGPRYGYEQKHHYDNYKASARPPSSEIPIVGAPAPTFSPLPPILDQHAAPASAEIIIEKNPVPATAEAPTDRQLVPVRAYLKSADIPPPSIGAYGIVAFRAKPTTANRDRLLMACKAYVASIPPQKSIPDTVRISDQMLTIWPLENPSAPEAAKDDCNFAIDHYDLYAADSAISDATKQGAKFGDDGPFLIGWSPSNTRGLAGKLVLVVDMSSYGSQDSFDHAFLFWKQKIVENPELWRSGFSIEAVRLAVRDFVDHYGETISTAAVSVWKK